MTEDELTSWKENPVTQSLLGAMKRYADQHEQFLKDRAFESEDAYDWLDQAKGHLDGYRTVIETLSTIGFPDYEQLLKETMNETRH